MVKSSDNYNQLHIWPVLPVTSDTFSNFSNFSLSVSNFDTEKKNYSLVLNHEYSSESYGQMKFMSDFMTISFVFWPDISECLKDP